MDEASPHMHFDYIPVAEGYKIGVQKRNSLDRAMRNLIAVRTGSEYSPRPDEKDASGKCTDNATKQWKEKVKTYTVHCKKLTVHFMEGRKPYGFSDIIYVVCLGGFL